MLEELLAQKDVLGLEGGDAELELGEGRFGIG